MRTSILISALSFAIAATAQVKTEITQFNHSGPFAVSQPFATDTVDVKGTKFESTQLLTALPLTAEATTTFSGQVLPSLSDSKSVGQLSFYINNANYLKGKIEVKGPKHYKLFIDAAEAGGELKLSPEHHTFCLRYLAEPKDTDSIRVIIDSPVAVEYTLDKRHPFMGHDLFDGKRVRGVSISADGSMVCVSYQNTERDGTSRWNYELVDVKSGRLLSCPNHQLRWMPLSVACLEDEKTNGIRTLYKVDPLTGKRTKLASGLPDGSYNMSPTEDYLIISVEDEGPKEDPGVFEVVEMDDRQPGWRNRRHLVRFDLKSGITQRITFGSKGENLYDISQDGRKLLLYSSYSRLSKRPTEVEDIYIMDAQTLKVDTILQCQGFLGHSGFSPDGTQIMFVGTPEAFDRIGCQLPADVTPSMTENELFLYDIATKKITPMTKDFDPSIDGGFDWSWADGMVYFRAECRDYVYLYQLNPKTGKIQQLPLNGDNIYRFDMAAHAPTIAYLSYKTMV